MLESQKSSLSEKELKMHKTRLERELAGSIEKATCLRRELADATARCHQLEMDLSASQRAQANSPSAAEIENNALQLAIAEWRTKASRFESLFRGLEEQTAIDHAELQQASLRQQNELESLNQQLVVAKELLDESTTKLATALGRAAMLEVENAELMKNKFVPENISDLMTSAALVADIKSKLVGLSKDNASLQGELSSAKEQVLAERAAKMSAQIDLVAARNENAKITQSLKVATREATDKGTSAATLSSRCDDLERQIKKKPSAPSSDLSSSVFDGTMDLLTAPIMPVASFLGISGPQKVPTAEALPGSTIMSPARPDRVAVIRTHEKLRSKRAGSTPVNSPMRAPLPPRSPSSSSSSSSSTSYSTSSTSVDSTSIASSVVYTTTSSSSPRRLQDRAQGKDHESGVLGSKVISMTLKTPTKSEFNL